MMTTKTDDELRKETLDSSEAMEDDARYKILQFDCNQSLSSPSAMGQTSLDSVNPLC